MDTDRPEELVDDGPDPVAFRRRVDALKEEALKVLAERADNSSMKISADPTVTVPVECLNCGAEGEVTVTADVADQRVTSIVDVSFPGTEGTAWVGRDGSVVANCGHRECQ